MRNIAPGAISLWSGAIVAIPDGYVLCDGNNGTEDLRDKFIPSQGPTFRTNHSGGVEVHDHLLTQVPHTHNPHAGVGSELGGTYGALTDAADTSGRTADANQLPEYYSLAYVMEV